MMGIWFVMCPLVPCARGTNVLMDQRHGAAVPVIAPFHGAYPTYTPTLLRLQHRTIIAAPPSFSPFSNHPLTIIPAHINRSHRRPYHCSSHFDPLAPDYLAYILNIYPANPHCLWTIVNHSRDPRPTLRSTNSPISLAALATGYNTHRRVFPTRPLGTSETSRARVVAYCTRTSPSSSKDQG